ncbi:MAG: serine hydrolase [Candidatus Omnitrophica bacterium]|nr:serine hydrolase [Candidatus Omnitrophota bacterium]
MIFPCIRKKIVFVVLLLIICTIGSYNIALLKKQSAAWRVLNQACEREIAKFNGKPCIVIKDLSRGWKIEVNKDTAIPSASIVKIAIMAGCFYAIAQGRMDLETLVVLRANDQVAGSGVLKSKPEGIKIPVKQLIELMITKSDNTATNMLISLLSFDYLNSCFREFGLEDTNISRKMMDMKSRGQGIENYTTAQDMALLLEKIYAGDLVNRDVSVECIELLKRQTVNDRIPLKLPAGVVVAHKTGLEKGICHDAGIVFTDWGDFLICVLVQHNHPISRRTKNFISAISLLTYNYYKEI